MTDEKKPWWKTIFAILGGVLAAIGAFILGRGSHGRGVQRAKRIADDIGDGIDTAAENNRAIESGIDRASERVGESENLVDVTERHNQNALSANQRAQDILDRARSRSKPGTDR